LTISLNTTYVDMLYNSQAASSKLMTIDVDIVHMASIKLEVKKPEVFEGGDVSMAPVEETSATDNAKEESGDGVDIEQGDEEEAGSEEDANSSADESSVKKRRHGGRSRRSVAFWGSALFMASKACM
jgi:hypothetical protein